MVVCSYGSREIVYLLQKLQAEGSTPRLIGPVAHRSHYTSAYGRVVSELIKCVRYDIILHMKTHTCSKCGETKSVDQFSKRNNKNKTPASRCKPCAAAVSRQSSAEKWASLTEQDKLKMRMRRHGLSEGIYQELMVLQDGKCAVCKTAEPTAVDHDHACCSKTYGCPNCIRGLLCTQCNTALGLLKDDKVRLQSAIDYLSKGRHTWMLARTSDKSWAGIMTREMFDKLGGQIG